MDNKTLKALVVEYKDGGYTYQEISDKLQAEYGLNRSRQALQGMYQRAIKDNSTDKQKERLIALADIVNIYCLGYNMSEVKDMVNDLGYSLTYNDVVITIKEQKEYIEEVQKSLIEIVEHRIKESKYITDLNGAISYKGIMPTTKQLKFYVTEAYKVIISKDFSDTLLRVHEFTDDKKVAKKIVEDLNLQMCQTKARLY